MMCNKQGENPNITKYKLIYSICMLKMERDMSVENTKYICVGKIVNTHGLKGEVKIYPYLNPKEDFDCIKSLIVDYKADIDVRSSRINDNTLSVKALSDKRLEESGHKLDIISTRYQKNMVLARFDGLNRIEDVEGFKNHLVYVLKDEIAEDDGFFYSDIIGFDVVDERLGKIGVISDVTQGAAQDIFSVEKDDGKSFMIPSVKEFIKDIDIDGRKIVVALIDGMME